MATRQLFYLDAPTLESATAVYTDVTLQTLAPMDIILMILYLGNN